MKQILVAAALCGGLALAQQMDHDKMVRANGDQHMGFSHEKTTHHFELNYDGGVIDVRADDTKDAESIGQIQSHFQHIAQMFSAGNFNVPMLVHGVDVPGTAAMTKIKDQIHWELQRVPRGARINITADNKAARDAVHEFLRFQIADHKTGDCTMVR